MYGLFGLIRNLLLLVVVITVLRSVIGLVMIQLLKNGLALTGVKGDATIVVIGTALILSVLIASSMQRRRDKSE